MKKVLLGIVISLVLLSSIIVGVIIMSFTTQYNKNFVSNFLCISIDESKGVEYIGEYDGYQVYTYNLNEAYFIDFIANNIELSEGLSSGKITLEDMRKHLKLKETIDAKIYESDNYKIIIKDAICAISPLGADNQAVLKDINSSY